MRAVTVCDGSAIGGRGPLLPEQTDDPGDTKDQIIEVRCEDDKAFPLHLPLASWPEEIVRYLKRSGTPFGHFVMKAIQSCRGVRHDAPPDALFPIPLPLDGAWIRTPHGLSKERRLRLAFRRMVHLCVIALNFIHHRAPFSSLTSMRRCPGVKHVQLFARINALCRACGPTEVVSILGCGRKSHQLNARFAELLQALQCLGLEGKGYYGSGHVGQHVPVENNTEELVPYRPLNASRLKLTGKGEWDCREFLSDLLYLPFCEPRINEFEINVPEEEIPDCSRVPKEEVEQLMKVWDSRGLLRLLPASLGPRDKRWCVKVFNNYKDAHQDRQIGDRRAQNYREGKLGGPSKSLPNGSALLQVQPLRFKQKLIGCAADRKDFYHQYWITDEKASYNAVLPFFIPAELGHLAAWKAFEEKFLCKRKAGDRTQGDFLHGRPPPLLSGEDARIMPTFGALFQGDHLGVEVATDSHSSLLQSYGLLRSASRLTGDWFIYEDEVVDGLIIDDYCVISKEWVEGLEISEAASVRSLGVAKRAYADYELIGSDGKDVVGADIFKFAGAEVVSSEDSVARGVVSLGAPYAKRLGLGLLSAAVASLRQTSDAVIASVVGSWVSILLYRRPLMSVMNQLFQVVPPDELNTEVPMLRPLRRAAAEELQVLAVLAPITCSNLAVPFGREIYATDASNLGGGIAFAEADEAVVKVGWRSADRKGRNLPMMRRSQAILASHDADFEELPLDDIKGYEEQVGRPLGLHFDFIEICGGVGSVTKAMIGKGFCCGPIFDLSHSKQFDLKTKKVVEWVLFMLESDRLQSVMIEPPCTTFSPAAFPSLRSYQQPRGFDQNHPRVVEGNCLAFAMLAILFCALRMKKPALGEQPRRSKMTRLQEWKRLLLLGAQTIWTASCMFGSPHQKEFIFITVNMNAASLHRRCSRDHTHVRIEGKWTKASAIYCEGLAEEIAETFARHLTAMNLARDRLDLRIDGLEDCLTNDLCLTLPWKTFDAWRWKKVAHINILEVAATLKLFSHVAKGGGDCRFLYLGDSHVARSVLARGRSSSTALQFLLKRAASVCVGYGLYPSGRFAPTRWNPGDAPSREEEIEEAVDFSLSLGADNFRLARLASLGSLRRWTSNWLRLVLLLAPALLDFDLAETRKSPPFPIEAHEWSLDFDSTLGYPGEGPCSRPGPLFLLWVVLSLSGWWIVAAAPKPRHGHGDTVRRDLRAGIFLDDGRRVTERTKFTRDSLFEAFASWLSEKDIDLLAILECSPPDIDSLNKHLAEYGRWLFREGKPYYHFSETINSVTSRRPLVRRSLQQAWDLCFMWGSHEPPTHHLAMPPQILTGVLAISLMWGWTREAAIFALAWGALLRIGEIYDAYRRDLVMPADVGHSIDFCLLKISEPKTRFRAARHQAGKLEQPDLIEIVRIGLGGLNKDEKLWSHSGSTLRLRLTKILQRLGLPTEVGGPLQVLSLASFRPGGATWLITQTESAELVRRRGRWASFRIMECYLQEVASSTYLTDIDERSRSLVLQALEMFPRIFTKVIQFHAFSIPSTSWYFLFARPSEKPKGNVGQTGQQSAAFVDTQAI